MKLTWYGHSCFLLETAQGCAVFDPYAPGSVPGLSLPKLRADAVFPSHGHGDHGYTQGVELSGEKTGFKVETIVCFHDEKQGSLRGENTITVIEAEGLRVAHLGDLGHMLSEEQISALGRIDLLLIPVGGYYTIDTATALELTKRISPTVTVPMHYRGEGFGYDVISTVDEFAEKAENVRIFDTNRLEIGEKAEKMTAVLKCPR